MDKKVDNKQPLPEKEYGNEALNSGYSIKEGKELNHYVDKDSYEAAKKKFQENPDANKRYEFNTPTGKEGEIKRKSFYNSLARGAGLTDKEIQEVNDFVAAKERQEARERAKDPLGIAKSHNIDRKIKDMSWDKKNAQFGQFVDMVNADDKYRDYMKIKPGQDIDEDDLHVTTSENNRSDLYNLFKQELDSGRFKTDSSKFIKNNPGTPDNVQEVENKNRDTIRNEYRKVLDDINKQLAGPFSRDDLLTPEQKQTKQQLITQAQSYYAALKEKDPLNEEKVNEAIDKDVEESNKAPENLEQKHEAYNKVLNRALHSDIPAKYRQLFNYLVQLNPQELENELNKNAKLRAYLDKKRGVI